MKRIKEEAEVIVRLDYDSQSAYICVAAWPSMANKMERLFGPGLDKDTEGQSRRWTVPIKSISFRRPKTDSAEPEVEETELDQSEKPEPVQDTV